jgi:hypothetical protein
MTSASKGAGNSLRGKKIFLSASIPRIGREERYHRVPDAPFEIEQAVISLARAVFSEGGRLVFGGHPSISPLVAMVVGEYREPRFAESAEEQHGAPIEIFQSRAFEGHLPDETLLMYRLGYASITWIEAVGGEHYEPEFQNDEAPCPQSMQRMRTSMLDRSSPNAMVCIGGMEGLEAEVKMVLDKRPKIPIYVLERTGGAAGLLRERYPENLRMIDTEVISRVDQLRAELRHRTPIEESRFRALVPYPLVMQTIVEEIAAQK